MEGNRKKLVIINEFLENKIGHYYEYDKSVMLLLQEHGLSCTLYAKATLANDIQEELNAIPYFQYNPKTALRKLKFIGPFLYRFANWRSLSKQIQEIVLAEIKNNPNTQFFVPNIFWYNVLPYALAFSKQNYPVQLLYRTSILEAIDIGEKYKPLIFKLYNWSFRLFSKNKTVQYATDSDVIAHQFEKKYGEKMRVLPIPHVFEINDLDKPEAKTQFRLYLPGGARIEKGIELVTEALEYLQAQQPEFLKKLIVVAQFFGDKEKEVLDKLQERIKKLDCTTVFLGKLSSEEYKEQFGLADIIMIPYLNSRGYKARTSGVLAESIAASKPFITSKDSWMDFQVKQYNTGLAVSDSSKEELANGIVELINRYQDYKTKAIEAKSRWLDFHSTENFYTIFSKP